MSMREQIGELLQTPLSQLFRTPEEKAIDRRAREAAAHLQRTFSFSPRKPFPAIKVYPAPNIFETKDQVKNSSYNTTRNRIKLVRDSKSKEVENRVIYEEMGHYLHLTSHGNPHTSVYKMFFDSAVNESIGYVCSKVGDPSRKEMWTLELKLTKDLEDKLKEREATEAAPGEYQEGDAFDILCRKHLYNYGKYALHMSRGSIAQGNLAYRMLAWMLENGYVPGEDADVLFPKVPSPVNDETTKLTALMIGFHELAKSTYHLIGYDLGEALWALLERDVIVGTDSINALIAAPPNTTLQAMLDTYRILERHEIPNGLTTARSAGFVDI